MEMIWHFIIGHTWRNLSKTTRPAITVPSMNSSIGGDESSLESHTMFLVPTIRQSVYPGRMIERQA